MVHAGAKTAVGITGPVFGPAWGWTESGAGLSLRLSRSRISSPIFPAVDSSPRNADSCSLTAHAGAHSMHGNHKIW